MSIQTITQTLTLGKATQVTIPLPAATAAADTISLASQVDTVGWVKDVSIGGVQGTVASAQWSDGYCWCALGERPQGGGNVNLVVTLEPTLSGVVTFWLWSSAAKATIAHLNLTIAGPPSASVAVDDGGYFVLSMPDQAFENTVVAQVTGPSDSKLQAGSSGFATITLTVSDVRADDFEANTCVATARGLPPTIVTAKSNTGVCQWRWSFPEGSEIVGPDGFWVEILRLVARPCSTPGASTRQVVLTIQFDNVVDGNGNPVSGSTLAIAAHGPFTCVIEILTDIGEDSAWMLADADGTILYKPAESGGDIQVGLEFRDHSEFASDAGSDAAESFVDAQARKLGPRDVGFSGASGNKEVNLDQSILVKTNVQGVMAATLSVRNIAACGYDTPPTMTTIPLHVALWPNFSGGLDLSSVSSTLPPFPGANWQTLFEGANLRGAVLGKTAAGETLVGADLSNFSLKGVSSGEVKGKPKRLPSKWGVYGGYLIGPYANLAGADLSGVDLSAATLDYVTSGNVKKDASTRLPKNWTIISGFLIGPNANLNWANIVITLPTTPPGFATQAAKWNVWTPTESGIRKYRAWLAKNSPDLAPFNLDGALIYGATIAFLGGISNGEPQNLLAPPGFDITNFYLAMILMLSTTPQ